MTDRATDMTAHLHIDDHRLLMQQLVPYIRTLGLDLRTWGQGQAEVRMAPSPRLAPGPDDARIDPLVLVGLIDQGLSDALASVVPFGTGMSTLELQIQFCTVAPPRGEVCLMAETVHFGGTSAIIRGMVHDAAGALIATSSALFRVGQFPTPGRPDSSRSHTFDPAGLAGPCAALIGLERHGEDLALRADNPAILGWASGNILHGGAVGALLMAACTRVAPADQALTSLTIHYLRPSLGSRRLIAQAEPVRQGAAASFIAARCHQTDGRPTAQATAVFTQTA